MDLFLFSVNPDIRSTEPCICELRPFVYDQQISIPLRVMVYAARLTLKFLARLIRHFPEY